MKVEIFLHSKKTPHLCGVIYEHEKQFICAEPSSSMGFNTYETALNWLKTVCKGEPFTPDNGCYKMMPADVEKEVKKQMIHEKAI